MRRFLTGRRSTSTCTQEVGTRGRKRGSPWLLGGAFLAIAVVFAVAPGISFAANPSANLDQCANDPLPSSHLDGCNSSATQWVNGNLGSSKSVYFEGDSIPYRMTFGSLSTSAPHAVTIEWDTTKSSKHAIDYIDSYNQSVANANPCLGVSGCSGAPTSTRAIPADPQVTGAGVTPIAGSFSLWGGTITSITRPSSVGNVACTAANSSGSYCYSTGTGFSGDKSAAVTINFTASVANPVLAWGGHIATRSDWGLSNSAVSISGSPYHTRLIDLDGAGGNQDRSLSADAVIFPGFIHIIKDATGGNNTFPYTASPSPLSDFNLTTAASSSCAAFAGCAEKDFNNITNFQTYTVTEGTLPTAWAFDSLNCSVASPNGGSQVVSNKTATINLKEGEEVTCTYANHFVASPGISIVKSSDSTFSAAGDVLDYSYLVTNTGNVPLTGITVTDNNIDDPPGVSCPATTLAVGANMTCTAQHTVTQAEVDNGCEVVNTSSVSDDQGDSDSDSLTIDGTCSSSITIVKSSTSTFAGAGDVLDYSYLVTNTGAVTDTNIVVTDDNIDDPPGVSCPSDTLAPGGSMTCTAQHTVTQAEVDNGCEVVNTSSVSDDQGDSDSDSLTIDGNCTPQAQILPTQTTCQQYVAGQGQSLGSVSYGVKSNKINNVAPGVFFYYSFVTVASNGSTLTVPETNLLGWKPIKTLNTQAFLYTTGCVKLGITGTESSTGTTDTITYSNVPAGTYVIGIKYDTSTLVGQSVSKQGGHYPTNTYSYITKVNGTDFGGSAASVDVTPK